MKPREGGTLLNWRCGVFCTSFGLLIGVEGVSFCPPIFLISSLCLLRALVGVAHTQGCALDLSLIKSV
jgi:hypothetical protein